MCVLALLTQAYTGDQDDLVGAAFGSARLTGCYRSEHAYFTGRTVGPDSIAVARSTAVLAFSSDTLRDDYPTGTLHFAVRPAGLAIDPREEQRRRRFSHWRPAGDREVVITWRDGFSGPVFRFTIDGDTLRGRMRFTTDHSNGLPNPVTWWRRSRAVRTPCP
jgi:hypothetical protein